MNKQTEWAAHVAAWRNSGKTASVYCAEQGLKLGALRYWSGRITRGQGSGGAELMRRVRFAQVRPPSSERVVTGPALVMSIGEVSLQVPAGADVGVLRETVAMLLEVAGGRR